MSIFRTFGVGIGLFLIAAGSIAVYAADIDEDLDARQGATIDSGKIAADANERVVDEWEFLVGEITSIKENLKTPKGHKFTPFETDRYAYIARAGNLTLTSTSKGKYGVATAADIYIQLYMFRIDTAGEFPLRAKGNLVRVGGGGGGPKEKVIPVAHWQAKVKQHVVSGVEFVAKDSELTTNDNKGGGERIFPGKQSPKDKKKRNIVTVKATIRPVTKGIRVFFESFDVDDPSSNGADLDDESKGVDNRGAAVGGTLSARSALTNTKGEAFVDLEVTYQPGDNFRVVAVLDAKDIAGLKAKQNDTDKARVVDSANQPVPEKNATGLLTVWRTLHVERDSMASVKALNKVTGEIEGIEGNVLSRPSKIILSINLFSGPPIDISPNLDGGANKKGRFENGTIFVGTDKVKTTDLDGNGNNDVRSTLGISVPFTIKKGVLPLVSGHVVGFQKGLARFDVDTLLGGQPLNSSYDGGTITVAGVSMTIGVVENGNKAVTVTALKPIPFELVDDDTHDLPTLPDISLMGKFYGPAYIEIANDEGGTKGNNSEKVTPVVSLAEDTNTALGKLFQVDSDKDRANDFWIAYLLSAYQPTLVGDRDADAEVFYRVEDGVRKALPRPLGSTLGGNGARLGSAIWQENIDEFEKQAGYPIARPEYRKWFGKRQLREQRTIVHEVAHQFHIGHEDGAIMGPNYDNNESFHADGDPKFKEIQLHYLRSRIKSPGKKKD